MGGGTQDRTRVPLPPTRIRVSPKRGQGYPYSWPGWVPLDQDSSTPPLPSTVVPPSPPAGQRYPSPSPRTEVPPTLPLARTDVRHRRYASYVHAGRLSCDYMLIWLKNMNCPTRILFLGHGNCSVSSIFCHWCWISVVESWLVNGL